MIYIVVNTKGGVGKSTVAYQALPLVLDNTINVEIDSSQSSKLKNSSLESYSYNAKTIADAIDKIDFKSMDKNIIVDIGADENVRKFFKDIEMIEDLKQQIKWLIPLNHDIEYIDNVLDTHNQIKKFDSKADISLVLNRCRSFEDEELKKQFKVLFGDETLNLPDRLKNMKINNVYMLVETDYISLVKVNYQKTLKEVEPIINNLIENAVRFKTDARKKSEIEFKKVTTDIRIAKAVQKLIAQLRKSFSNLKDK